MLEYCRTFFKTVANAASFSSDPSARQPNEIRPASSTPVASTISIPAPDIAKVPKCIACQSVALPSTAEYWHMGLTTIRLGSVTERSENGVNNWLVIFKKVLTIKTGGMHYRRACFIRGLLTTQLPKRIFQNRAAYRQSRLFKHAFIQHAMHPRD